MSSPPLSPQASQAALDDQALDWFMRSRAGLSSQELAELQRWRDAAPAHAAALARCQRDWDELGRLPSDGVAELRAQLARDLASARVSERASERAPSSRRRHGGWRTGLAWGAAASVLLLAGGAYLAWQVWQQPLYEQCFVTERGQQLALHLPDGSHLQLDTATRGELRLYRQRRELRLPQGQAMFQVAPDAARPFEVLAGPLRITVLGTRFAVRYTPTDAADGRVQVAVEEGHVRVASGPSGRVVELHAGQQVASDAQGRLGAVAAVPAAGVAGWREGRLSVEDVTLAQVLAELERYGPTGLVLGDARLGRLRLSGTFDPRHPENLRRVLPQVLPVRLQPVAAGLAIVPAP